MKTFILIISIGTIVLAWFFLDFQLGKRQFKKQHRPRFYPYREGHYQWISSGPALFEQLFNELSQAKNSIYLLFYIVKEDNLGIHFFNILEEKAREGLDVRLLLDRIGSRSLSSQRITQLKSAGVHVHFCHLIKGPFYFYTLQQRNHRKTCVIDHQIGYLGGYNVGNEYIDLAPPLSPWRDYHLKMEGPIVHDLEQEFLIDWARATSSALLLDMNQEDRKNSPGVRLLPSEGLYMETYLILLIERAQRSIIIGTPYFIPTLKLQKTFLKILAQGIHVKIILPEKKDHAIVKEASYRYIRELIENGAEVYHYLNGFYHAKIVAIDEAIVDFGTANFDRRSILLNFEMNVLIEEDALVKKIVHSLEQDMKESRLVLLEELKNVNMKSRLKEWIGRIMANFL
jgi:cardiolipin synthase